MSKYIILLIGALYCIPPIVTRHSDIFETHLRSNHENDISRYGSEASDYIFNSDVRDLKNYPYEKIYGFLNKACSTIVASGIVKPHYTPDPEKMNLILLKSLTENYTFPLIHSHDLWTHHDFNSNLETIILMNGWRTSMDSYTVAFIHELAKAYFCRGRYNVIAFDPSIYIQTLYTWSSFNTDLIGKYVAESLRTLIDEFKYSSKKIHIIGLSLGAQIAGSTGKHYNEMTDDLFGRITGLDPANPCFNEGEKLSGLGRGDAEFVDIIHTNSGALGKREPNGDVDFYPNGITISQPGCDDTLNCAHIRSAEYYVESIYPGNEMGFMAVKCTSLEKVTKKICKGKPYPMGFATPTHLKGNFFLSTNSKTPYGKDSTDPSEIRCRNTSRVTLW